MASVNERTEFWSQNQPGFRFSSAEIGSPGFFVEVEAHRYKLEPHVPELAQFDSWKDRDVLETGCGIATDGIQFARAGAHYTGLDMSPSALALASHRFDLDGQEGRFVEGSVTALPFEDESFDFVYSHGVIHHVPDTQKAIHEFHRVLRPGGRMLAMVYHRDSLNYRVNIMVLRRTLIALLLVPGIARVLSRLLGEDQAILDGQRELLLQHGLGYVRDKQLFLSNNTDGPRNPLSKVFSRRQAREMCHEFQAVSTETRYLNLRIYPGGERLAATALAKRLETGIGWHLYISALKAS